MNEPDEVAAQLRVQRQQIQKLLVTVAALEACVLHLCSDRESLARTVRGMAATYVKALQEHPGSETPEEIDLALQTLDEVATRLEKSSPRGLREGAALMPPPMDRPTGA